MQDGNSSNSSNSVNITVGKDIIDPIVKQQIKGAIIASLGGKEMLVEQVMKNIMFQKVNDEGKVSNYSSDNKYCWLDHILTKQLEKISREAVIEILTEEAANIKLELVRILQTKKGSNQVAQALIDSMNGTFGEHWNSKISIDFKRDKD